MGEALRVVRPPATQTGETPELEFRILGRFEVLRGGERLLLAGGIQQALLAMLLLNANEPLSRDLLIKALWGYEPPQTAAKMINNNISRLRRLLEPNGASGGEPQQVLATQARGYELRIDPDQLDARRFERLIKEGRQALARGAPDVAAAKLREGLALWRGPALAEFDQELFAEAEAARLEELRLGAINDRIEAELALGHHDDLVGELESLVTQYPLRERLRAHLMLALYRSGRQAEALELYQKTRQLLVEALGIEPTRSLQELERAILLQDPSLDLDEEPPPLRLVEEPPPSAQAPPREVRKTVSVVFAEVAPLGQRLDPEAVRAPMSRSLELASSVLERHGGSVKRVRPGAINAVFGIPVVHEDDALRAVRATAELQQALANLNRELEQGWRIHVALRAAVNTGEVVATEGTSGEGVVAGDALDVAAQLQQAADSDEILVADATKRLAEQAVRLEPVEPLVLKGTPEPLQVWRLLDVVQEAPLAGRRHATPMVGRERELAQLRQAFEAAVDRRTPHLFTVLGPAGIGKSRLAAEFTASLANAATVATGRCLPYGEAITYWPLAEIVRQVAGDDPRESLDKLLDEDPEAAVIADRLASAMGVAETAQPSAETFWAARELFEALADTRPLVLVFEDLHWAEPTFLDLIEYLTLWVSDAPILIMCLARPELLEDRQSWAAGKVNATSILLEPLSERESQLLMRKLVEAAELPEEAVEGILRVAEGNPLFLEEMLSMLNEEGFARGAVGVPPTIQALLGARLDRLQPEERMVLGRAAVIGQEFSRAAIVELLPEDARASHDARLGLLVRRELIRPHRSLFGGDEGFRFRHILLREAAYASVPKEVRAELHERYAVWLERKAGSRAREFEEIVGHHLEQAFRYRTELRPADERARELAVRAADRLARAGRRAYAREDLPAAVGLLSRASELLDPRVPSRSELLVDLSEAFRETGDLERAEAVLTEASEAASASDDPALQWHARIASLRLQRQTDPEFKTDELLRDATRAVEVFERAGDERRLAEAWSLLAWVPWFQCQASAAEQALQRAVEHARRAGDTRTEAQSLDLLIGAAWFGPLPVPEAIRRCEEIVARFAEQRRIKASALRALAGLKAMQGDFDEARELIERHRGLVQDLELSVTAAHAAETYGIVEMLAGDPVAAERELRRGYETLEQKGGEMNVSPLAALLAQALSAQGRAEEALVFTELSERAALPDDRFAHVEWRSARAKALAALGQPREAEVVAREAVTLAEQTDFLVVHADALMILGEVLRVAGGADESLRVLEQALALYEQKGNIVAAGRARAELRAPSRA
jgi:DNA-binding SARP family transcriptional activator/class 3 adenylate cyclase